MARIRSVHPDICTDEILAEVSPSAERTFVRLWTHLDDEGRCIDNVKLLKAALYPLHDNMTANKVDQDISELVLYGLLIRYEAEGKRIIATKSKAWHNWQKPKHPTPSKLPEPARNHPCPPTPIRGSPTPQRGEDVPGSLHGVVDGVVDGVVVGGELRAPEHAGKLALPSNGSSPPATVSNTDHEFEQWWIGYPRKVGKPSALRAWRKARKSATYNQLAQALEAWTRAWNAQQRTRDKLPHAATWLNDHRWEDTPEADIPQPPEPKGFAGIRAALESQGS